VCKRTENLGLRWGGGSRASVKRVPMRRAPDGGRWSVRPRRGGTGPGGRWAAGSAARRRRGRGARVGGPDRSREWLRVAVTDECEALMLMIAGITHDETEWVGTRRGRIRRERRRRLRSTSAVLCSWSRRSIRFERVSWRGGCDGAMRVSGGASLGAPCSRFGGETVASAPQVRGGRLGHWAEAEWDLLPND